MQRYWSSLLMGTQNGTATLERRFGSSYEVKYPLPIWPIPSTPRCLPQRYENAISRNPVWECSLMTQNRTAHMSSNCWMDKWTVVHPYSYCRTLLSVKKQLLIHTTMQIHFKCSVLRDRSQTPICRIPRASHTGKGQVLGSENRSVVARDWGVEFTIREFWGDDEKYSTVGSGYTISCICQNSKNYIPKRWDALYVNYTSIFFKRGKCPHSSAGSLILTWT